ncbi:hypothetical protein [Halotalea alkalilenta]|uniref:hypothetical protein n=1 Tax=Halotalea alkalilenta TaxID=376489 RepID=UPI000489850E|nr:hypothetical protein [Halotalea alkalilenta]
MKPFSFIARWAAPFTLALLWASPTLAQSSGTAVQSPQQRFEQSQRQNQINRTQRDVQQQRSRLNSNQGPTETSERLNRQRLNQSQQGLDQLKRQQQQPQRSTP